MIDDPLTAQASDVFSASSGSPRTLPLVPSRKLYAIGDIHLSFKPNRIAWEDLRPHPTDGLILVGDVGETKDHCDIAFAKAKSCFHTVFWCPGNHELYTLATHKNGRRGVSKYMECVESARAHGVITPEDPYQVWDGDGGPCLIAPIFTLYDYSFKPDDVPIERAVEWAKEHDVLATDEMLLHPDPYPTRQDWCAALIEKEEKKLAAARADHPDLPLIIINHWPLRQDLVKLTLVPRFRIWCGTTKTENWHKRFNAKVVVSGHLHVRRTDWKDGTRFEECSLGYPKQWRDAKEMGKDVNDMLREILPGPEPPLDGDAPTLWRRMG